MSNVGDAELSPLMPEESVSLMLTAVALSVVATFSNGLLLYVVVRTSALHTSTNVFIASLSAGELLTGLFVIPFAGTATTSGDWAFTPALCRLVGFMGVMGPCVSALSLLVVSADRYVAISIPLRYAGLVTNRSTVAVVVLVWSLSLLMSLLPLLSWGSYSFSDSFKTCLMRSTADDASDVPEVVVKEVLSTFLPMALMVLIIFKTVHHIRGHRRVFAFVPIPIAATSLPLAASGNLNARKSRVRATRTLLLVSAAYVTFCVPSAVANVMCQSASSCYVTGRVLRALLWISFFSCFINPLIIMTLNGKFRARLRALFRRGRGRCGGLLQPGAGDKEPFTITSGLQAVLEASLLLSVVHGTGRQDANLRRHAIMTLQARTLHEDPQPVYVRRMGLVALRKTRSYPDCRLATLEAQAGGS